MATEKTAKKETEELVSVYIPRRSRSDTERFIAVNGERILVQTGKTVEIPRRFAEVLEHSEESARLASAFIENNTSL